MMLAGPDGVLGTADDVQPTLDTPGDIGIRVKATDNGGLSVTNSFVISVLPPNSPPNATDDAYTTLENVGLTTLATTGVLHNDVDPNADPFTAALVAGPANGTLTFHADGTFVYIPNHNFVGTDSFTYQDTDSAGAVSNVATATISVVDVGKITVAPTAPATTNAGIGAMLAYGGDGNDTFAATVGDGIATFDGQAGTNTFDLSQISADATVNLAAGTASSAQTGAATLIAVQNVVGGLGNDTITGDANNNTFFAAVGDGNDSYTGGAGSDTYDLSRTAAGATVNLWVGTATSADTGTDTLVGIENLVGSTGDDRFVAAIGDGNNSYDGGAGNDTYDLSATAAAATVNLALATPQFISADAGTDTLTAIENVTGGAGNDTITGDTNANVITGGAGNDTLLGGAGNDTFVATAGDGNDSDNGGGGSDAMTGAGNDIYFVDSTGDSVTENLNEGVDTVNVTLNSYTLGTNVENLAFIGGGGFTGTGNALDNTITGGGGVDTLNAGAGNDILIGGAGNDIFRFFSGFGADTITDFTIGQDKLDISGLGIKAAAFAGSVVIAGGTNALITIGGSSVTLTGVAAANIHATDFMFAA
jgi:Ca2+-binding RTX toxin-like protein